MPDLKCQYPGDELPGGCVEERPHGLAVDVYWENVLPHAPHPLQLEDHLKHHKRTTKSYIFITAGIITVR